MSNKPIQIPSGLDKNGVFNWLRSTKKVAETVKAPIMSIILPTRDGEPGFVTVYDCTGRHEIETFKLHY